MRFTVSHTTEYRYSAPASESFAELRLYPVDTPNQKVLSRSLKITPDAAVDTYADYFGNTVEFFSIPYRHNELRIETSAEVETHPDTQAEVHGDTSVAEARQIFNSQSVRIFDFLKPTRRVPILDNPASLRAGEAFFSPGDNFGHALLGLNTWIFENFKYNTEVTDVSTPISEVIAAKGGVCQDFAQLMLAILRSYGIPARYVSGYIEAYDPTIPGAEKLVGAAASHAWVEVFLPGGIWWGLDPTNNKPAGEQHVCLAVGRDYDDAAPMRGTYKGATDQQLRVIVSLKRKSEDDTHAPEHPA